MKVWIKMLSEAPPWIRGRMAKLVEVKFANILEAKVIVRLDGQDVELNLSDVVKIRD